MPSQVGLASTAAAAPPWEEVSTRASEEASGHALSRHRVTRRKSVSASWLTPRRMRGRRPSPGKEGAIDGAAPASAACVQVSIEAVGPAGSDERPSTTVRAYVWQRRIGLFLPTKVDLSEGGVLGRPATLCPIRLQCATRQGSAVRFLTAEHLEEYIAMETNVKSENFRCFCSDWIFSTHLVECTLCRHRMHVECANEWFSRRGQRSCPFCRQSDADGTLLIRRANKPVEFTELRHETCAPRRGGREGAAREDA